MRIGIITFQRSHNYGAVLQAYALLTTLKNMGHNAEIIDYWPSYRAGQYNLFKNTDKSNNKTTLISDPKRVIRNMMSFPYRWKKYSKFNNFIRHNLKIKNNPYLSGFDIPDNYDVIICGSDQIWRYNFRGNGGFDDVYFAKYPVNKKVIKVSYAASMGDKDIDENAIKVLKKLIENLDFISVREDALLDLVKPLTTKLPVKVLDPVFLLSEVEWRKMIKKIVKKKKYLLFYQLIQDSEAVALAKKIASERQLEIIQIRGVAKNVNPFGSDNLQLSAGPIDFISLIAHADYVVSTSYHGVAFSILFQKPFSALGFNNNCYRIKSLLRSLGIEQCLIEKKSDNYPDSINYTDVNTELKEMVKISLSFLNHSTSKAEYIEESITGNDLQRMNYT